PPPVLNESFASGRDSGRGRVPRVAPCSGGPAGKPAVRPGAPPLSVEPKAPLQPLPSRPTRSRRYESPGYRTKRLLLGPALQTSQLVHERISKRVALAVFSSDP